VTRKLLYGLGKFIFIRGVGNRNTLLSTLSTMVMRAEMLSALAIWRCFLEGMGGGGGRGGEQMENKKHYVGRVFYK